ncbi:MAG: hypothetical protein UHN41_06815 [Bacteroidales bacterium]|nr:hypothetical protein [Bacteroidales bacterium]
MVRKKRKYNFSNNPIVFRPMTVYNDRGVNIQEEVERQMSQQLPPLKSDVYVDEQTVVDEIPLSVPEVPHEVVPVPEVPHEVVPIPEAEVEIETETETIRDKSEKRLLYVTLGVAAAVLLFVLNQE